jgi:hypothetical protein
MLLKPKRFVQRMQTVGERSVFQQISNSSPASPEIHDLSVVADDTGKISNTLNLSLGLLWELNPALTGKNGQDAFTALGT